MAKSPGFSRPSAFAAIASTVSARWSARSDGDTKRTFAANSSPGYASTVSRTGWPDLDERDGLLGHRQLDAQRIDPHDRGDAACRA